MKTEFESKTDLSKPIDAYLGFEIFQKSERLYVARPQGWTQSTPTQSTPTLFEAEDLPTLRKRVWDWWHGLMD